MSPFVHSAQRGDNSYPYILLTEPVRLPDIPIVEKKKNTTWTIQEVDEKSRRTPTADDETALKLLKEKKQANRTEYRYNSV